MIQRGEANTGPGRSQACDKGGERARSSPQAIKARREERQESEARLRKSNEALVRIVEINRDVS